MGPTSKGRGGRRKLRREGGGRKAVGRGASGFWGDALKSRPHGHF